MSSSHYAILFIIAISLAPLHGSGKTQSLDASNSKTAVNGGKGVESNKLGSSVCLVERCPRHHGHGSDVCYCCFRDSRRCSRNLYACASDCIRQPPSMH
ncbi:EMBRYO SURROUNDING FACTOR 1-like protein 6 [Capsella rubella]|uniref:EMBRYO SURROUNDING FACTOR 1-like protein 6 n=1 Tax=Capsella rubella TaxID=81985 RepID=UPI000CD51E41|nr:EMBRYO SURROUNDING FACTOR 1-like protein 6 [Capsella rubella]